MSRLVIPKPTEEETHRGVTRSYSEDTYKDRVAKYIPAEVVGGYVGLDGIVNPSKAVVEAADPFRTVPSFGATAPDAPSLLAGFLNLQGFVFVLCLILAPIYVWHLARQAGIAAWKAQAAIAAVAFVVWAYAIKGSIFFQNQALDTWAQAVLGQPQFYDPKYGAALLIAFSLIIGFYQPKN